MKSHGYGEGERIMRGRAMGKSHDHKVERREVKSHGHGEGERGMRRRAMGMEREREA